MAAVVLAAALGGHAADAGAQETPKKRFNLPPNPLVPLLRYKMRKEIRTIERLARQRIMDAQTGPSRS